MNKKIIIAIDGPAASGKGSLAKKLAAHLDYDFLDTGALYRRVALDVHRRNINLEDEPAITACAEALAAKINQPYDDSALRTDEIGTIASKIAPIQGVRDALLQGQRDFARNAEKGAILDGRDIATVICPEADIKLFITASIEARAIRRYKELQSKGIPVTKAQVLAEMQERDERDHPRLKAHMDGSIDNKVIDTSELSPQAVFDQALEIIQSRS